MPGSIRTPAPSPAPPRVKSAVVSEFFLLSLPWYSSPEEEIKETGTIEVVEAIVLVVAIKLLCIIES